MFHYIYIYIYVFKALKTCGKNAPKHFLKMHHSTMNNIETTRKHNSCSPVLLCFLHIFNVFFKLFNVFMFSIVLCVFLSCSCFFYHSFFFLYCFLCFCLIIYIAANLCLLTYLQLQNRMPVRTNQNNMSRICTTLNSNIVHIFLICPEINPSLER